MRAILLLSLALGSCGHAPLAFRPLPWNVTPQDGMTALERAGMAPRYDEIRAYFAPPHCPPGVTCPDGAGGEPAWPVHTNEPVLLFTPRPGWRGEARFDNSSVLVSVSLTPEAETSPPALAARTVEELRRRHGAPAERFDWPGGGGHSLVWKRDGASLTVAIGDAGSLHVVYARAR